MSVGSVSGEEREGEANVAVGSISGEEKRGGGDRGGGLHFW